MKSMVLITTAPGEANAVYERLKRLSVVLECCMPFGRYDVAAMIEGETLEDLWQTVHVELNCVRGVASTFPCLVENGRSLHTPPEHLKELALFKEA